MNPGHHDLVGVGLGPSNLALAALAEPVGALDCLFLDENPEFSWHPGMMVEGAVLQVPFLADLVTLADPTSRHSYLAYLRDTGRLLGFYLAERLHVPRTDYQAYCRAVARALPACRFGARVTALRSAVLPDGRDGFTVSYETSGPARHTVLAANVVLGIGSEPVVPAALRDLCVEDKGLITHSAQYLDRAGWIRGARDVTVLGSGQSGAEVVLDLLRTWHRPGRRLRWLTRSADFEPAPHPGSGLERFTADYAERFHSPPRNRRGTPPSGRGRPNESASAETLAEIRVQLDARSRPGAVHGTGVTLMPGAEALCGHSDPDTLTLTVRHTGSGRRFAVRTERLILATGYAPRHPGFAAPISTLMERDGRGRPVVDRDHRVTLRGSGAGLYLQNAEPHTRGAPDLGLGAYRAAAIINAIAGRTLYPLPTLTSHNAFTPTVSAAPDPGIAPITEEPGGDQRRQPRPEPRRAPRVPGPRHAAADRSAAPGPHVQALGDAPGPLREKPPHG